MSMFICHELQNKFKKIIQNTKENNNTKVTENAKCLQ